MTRLWFIWTAVASVARHRFGVASVVGETPLGSFNPKRRRRFALPAHSINRFFSNYARAASFCCLWLGGAPLCTASFSDWRYQQELRVSAPGLIRVSAPIELIDAARPDLSDVRIVAPAGGETPFSIEHPRPRLKTQAVPKSFQPILGPASTTLEIETGFAEPIDSIELATPATGFLKAVQVEASRDGKNWETLARGRPIFRQFHGVTQMTINLPAGQWPFLRLTLDDSRSPAIPITGATLFGGQAEAAAVETMPARISDRVDANGQTRLTLDLGASNVELTQLEVQSPDALFMRRVVLAARAIKEDAAWEQELAQGTIFRVAIEGQAKAEHLTLPLNLSAPARELLLLIQNGDNPPLQIRGIQAACRPAWFLFVVKYSPKIRPMVKLRKSHWNEEKNSDKRTNAQAAQRGV